MTREERLNAASMLYDIAADIYTASSESETPVTSPTLAHRQLGHLAAQPAEELWVLTLDSKNRIINKHMVSRGGLNFAAAHPREVFRPAVLDNAAAVILAHNHPSGDPAESDNDIRLTAELRKAGEMLGIQILDHIIIAGPHYVSLKEKGAL